MPTDLSVELFLICLFCIYKKKKKKKKIKTSFLEACRSMLVVEQKNRNYQLAKNVIKIKN